MENGSFPPPNQPPILGPQPPQQQGAQDLQIARYFLLAAAILCPISVFLGVFFSIPSVVCAAIALVKIVKLTNSSQGALHDAAKRMQTIIIICFSLCVTILVLNIAAVVMVFPMVMEALQTGDWSALGVDPQTLEGLSTGGTTGDGSRTWG